MIRSIKIIIIRQEPFVVPVFFFSNRTYALTTNKAGKLILLKGK
jgi:hypothetical protein